MHSYLRAIGFGNLRKGSEIEKILQDVFQDAEERSNVKQNSQCTFMEYSKSFGENIGITLCGTLDEEGFHKEYYFPYFKGSGITTKEDLIIEKRGGSDSFTGICEDMRLGISMIFYLQNAARYLKKSVLNGLLGENITTTFSGLSLEGKVLLPICKTEEQRKFGKEANKNRSHLIAEARKGNEDAIESLTVEDMDNYSMISKRIQQEDVLSIVDSFFMPYGMECDYYHIMGEIKTVEKVQNTFTQEQVYQLGLECNEMNFDVCINAKDLQGEPELGRRFKGMIWLQGHVNFPEE